MKYRFKRIFVIVLDSLGVGKDERAKEYGDYGSNTFLHILENLGRDIVIPNLTKLGMYDFLDDYTTKKVDHINSYTCFLNEKSNGKDTMTGHWEMMGVHTLKPFQTFTDTGFPKALIEELELKTGHKIIGNKAASGTEILVELGEEQVRDNSLIVYTSADSVLQIAAHEEVTGLDELYRCCEIAREICNRPEYLLGRIIARPYIGTNKNDFKRVVAHRHDIALNPPVKTAMNILKDNHFDVSCIGKISDIFNGFGVTESIKTSSNNDGMDKTINQIQNKDFTGLCFVNLVEFDSEYGHRRDVKGYAKAIEEFDLKLGTVLDSLKEDDLLILTADHGNDPTWSGTDHTREKVPFIAYSKSYSSGGAIKERSSFADIGATILKNFSLSKNKDIIGTAIDTLLE